MISHLIRTLSRAFHLFFGVGPTCRFDPTCTKYAVEAYRKKNFFVASWLVVKRIGRCRPTGPYGYDPLPEGNNG